MEQLSKGFTSGHRQALQRALELQRLEMLRYLLSLPGMRLSPCGLAA